MYQAASPEKRKTMGFDLLNDADAEELEINRLANEWLRDGNPRRLIYRNYNMAKKEENNIEKSHHICNLRG